MTTTTPSVPPTPSRQMDEPNTAQGFLRREYARMQDRLHKWLGGGHGGPFSALRKHLILTNVSLAMVVMAVLGGALYVYQEFQVSSQIDHQLAAEAAHEIAKGPAIFDSTPGADTTESYNPESPNLFSIVLGKDHKVLQDDEGIEQLGLTDWTLAEDVISGETPNTYSTIERNGIRYRIYVEQVVQNGTVVGAIQTGTSLQGKETQIADFVRTLLLLCVGVIVLTAVSSIYLTDRALKPAKEAFVRQRQFAFAASHELRTPLAFIRSQAELLAAHRCPPPAVPEAATSDDALEKWKEASEEMGSDAQEIISEVDYMTRLIHRLLLLARDEADYRALAWERLNLAALARDCATRIRPQAEAKHLDLILTGISSGDTATAESLAVTYGDPDMLRELLIILLENATRYTPEGGKIWLEVHAERKGHHHAGHVWVRVSDTGKGIEPEHLPHIFEAFYRGDPARTHDPSSTGSGLGLALASWIVHAHNGHIDVHSVPGAGTTFTIHLPLAD